MKTFDGVPIDVNVALPARAHGGQDGPYPLVILLPGYGGAKIGLSAMQGWLDHGYSVLSMTPRGFGESCGTSAARAADPPACSNGYVHLADARYEVRDAQELAGLLVDERLVLPQQIGATGGSYGGAIAMSLGALRDRKMLPDGSLVPWTSPAGTAMANRRGRPAHHVERLHLLGDAERGHARLPGGLALCRADRRAQAVARGRACTTSRSRTTTCPRVATLTPTSGTGTP